MNPQLETVHQLVEAQVASTPRKLAVNFEGRCLTFAELEYRSNKVAHYLRGMGVGPNNLVALCVERSLDMLVGLLGILKAGGAYVPLDPTYPAARLDYMLKDSRSNVLVTESDLVTVLPKHEARIVRLDTDWAVITREPEGRLKNAVTGADLAYVIYTSGSTGRPKGVEIPHRAVVNLLRSMRDKPGLTAEDRLLAVTSLSFDIAVAELFLPLIVGARIVLVGRTAASDGVQLAGRLGETGATVMQATPATWRLLLEADWSGNPHFRILCGGETLTGELAERLLPCCGELWNLYGPTETTVWSSVQRVQTGQTAVPIGAPIANTEIHVLDEQGQHVDVDSPGEIYIGGAGLARGYLNRPELTAKTFVPHPFDFSPGARLYRTGDLGRYRADGSLDHLGRTDHQVKVCGFRIELGEIEAELDRHPSVRQAIVLAREDLPGDKRLVAYLAAAAGPLPSHESLREELRKTLPDYMIPQAFVFIDSLPLTPNGKVDRNALPAPGAQRPNLAQHYVASRTSNEERLAEICAEVLRLDRVGLRDDFFDLGGDSIKVAQVVARVRDAFHIELSPRHLFENRTVAGLMCVIDSAPSGERNATQEPLRSVSRTGHLPLSFSQERVWFIHQLNPENLAYNFQSTIRFRGPLDAPALERSLSEIVRRHEIYRTTFPIVDGQPTQQIHAPAVVSMPVVDLSELAEDEQHTAARQWCDAEFQRRLDITRLPLVRWTLLRFGQHDHVLVHMEHHLVHDGWSFNVFLRELLEIYPALAAGRPSPLPELPIQFADFAAWQRQWMQGEVAETQLAYWKRRLTGMPVLLELPADRPRPKTQTFRGAAPRAEIPPALCASLRSLCRSRAGTLFMTTLAGFVALLHRYTGQSDIAVGTVFANRRWRASESLIGMILNNVVIRTSLASDPTAVELVDQVRELVLEGASHQDVPFDRVVDCVKPHRDPSYNPLFQVIFGFHDEPMPEQAPPGLRVEVTPVISNGSAKFDLGVIVVPHSAQRVGLRHGSEADGLTMIWEYNTDLFDHAIVLRMIEHYEHLLEAMVSDPERRISELPLESCERRGHLVEWNDTAAEYPHDQCVHELFQQQAERTPDAVAVIFEDQELTYGELNVQANQLAHYLRSRGVGPETLVGLCVERSAELVIGILGILKAGGAYLPLVADDPRQRSEFILADAKVEFLIAQQNWSNQFRSMNCRMICLDSHAAAIQRQPRDNPLSRVDSKNLAYVMYTSGSTGAPKGVLIEHSAISNHMAWFLEEFTIGPEDSVLQKTPVGFDASVLEFFAPLLCGARLTLASPGAHRSPPDLVRTISKQRITVLQVVPSLLRALVNEPDFPHLDSLRLLLSGGEELTVSDQRELFALLPHIQLTNLYGPTETCIDSLSWQCDSTCSEQRVPIGRPIANTQVYVLDPQQHPVPIGLAGELYIGGAGLARGYLNRPELTAEKFLANPFDGEPNSRLYRSGDRCRWRADGNLEFLGRLDDQVKLRGFRIELGEIETVLNEHPSVAQCVVTLRENQPGDQRLVAYCVPAADRGLNLAKLRSHLSTRLPQYMVPAAFVDLKTLPLTSSGKVDRRELPAPDESRPQLATGYVAPRSPIEQQVASIWCEVLRIQRVGIHDNFFELGGHSLLAVKIRNRIERHFHTGLSLTVIFEHATPAELAEQIARAM